MIYTLAGNAKTYVMNKYRLIVQVHNYFTRVLLLLYGTSDMKMKSMNFQFFFT